MCGLLAKRLEGGKYEVTLSSWLLYWFECLAYSLRIACDHFT